MRLMLPKNTLYETSNHSRKLSRRDVRAQRHSSCRNTCNIRIYHCTSLSIKNIAEWCRRTWTQKRRLNMHTSRTNEKSVCLRSPRWRILQNNKSNHADCQRCVGTSLRVQRRQGAGGAAGGACRESSKTRRVSVVVLRLLRTTTLTLKKRDMSRSWKRGTDNPHDLIFWRIRGSSCINYPGRREVEAESCLMEPVAASS